MFLLFDEPVAECWNDVEVEVVIDDVQSSEFCVKTIADWINPYTYTFIAPGRPIQLSPYPSSSNQKLSIFSGQCTLLTPFARPVTSVRLSVCLLRLI